MKTLTKIVTIFVIMTNSISAEDGIKQRTEHWQNRYKEFETEADSLKSGGYVFLGNSITEGFNLEKYFPDWPVINRGIGSDHLEGVMARIENSAISLKPAKLFVLIGINDIGDQRSDKYIQSYYYLLADTLLKSLPGTEFYFHSILPTTKQWDNCDPRQIERLNRFIEKLCENESRKFIDLYPKFSTKDAELDSALTYDGLHLNEAGYKIWADHLKNIVGSAR